jgi:hypothetical protein
MTLPEVRDRQEGFGGGLNTTSDDTALGPTECRVAKNTRLSTRGAAEKRGGTQHVLAAPIAAQPVLGGFSWRRTSSVQELVVCNGQLRTGALALPMTLTAQTGTLSSSVYPTFAAFKGPTAEGVYIADGGALNFWDGVTLTTDIANTPAVESIVSWGPRLFAFKDDTVYWSSTTAGINGHTLGALAGGGQAIVRTYGGQELIAGAPLKNSLLLFHRQAISRFTGATQDDINIEAGTNGISGDIGTVAKNSIIDIENVVYFLTDRGAFAATETDVQPVSSPLEATLSALNKSDWLGVSAVHARAFNEVRWMIPGVGVYVFNYRTRGWTGPWDTGYASVTSLWDTVDADGRSVVLAGRSDGTILWCDRQSAWVDAIDSAGAGGTAYTWEVQCRRFYAQDYTTYKAWRTMYTLGEFPDPADTEVIVTTGDSTFTMPLPFAPQQVGVTLAWDHPSTTWDASGTVWSGPAGGLVERARVPLHGVHPWVDVSLRYTGNQSTRLSVVDVMGFARGRR